MELIFLSTALQILLDKMVLPRGSVTDFKAKFTGLSEKDLEVLTGGTTDVMAAKAV